MSASSRAASPPGRGGTRRSRLPGPKERLFATLSGALADLGVPWVVLHGYESLPEDWRNDLDLCVGPGLEGRAVDALVASLRRAGVPPLLAFHSAVGELALFCCLDEDPAVPAAGAAANDVPRFAQVDLTHDVLASTVVRTLSAAEILAEREERGDSLLFAVPRAELRFAYLLGKRVEKRALDDAQAARLLAAYGEARERAPAWAQRLLGRRRGGDVVDALERADVDALRGAVAGANRALFGRAIAADPAAFVWLRARDLRRYLDRLMRPSGLSVAVLGTDGVGKSTVIDALEAHFASGFLGVARGHLRPTVLPDLKYVLRPEAWRRAWQPWQPGAAPQSPHEGAASGPLGSLARLAYYGLDYTLGHPLRLRLPAVRNRLVLFDRYHVDWLVDPRRWKIALPEPVRRAAQRRLPEPDLPADELARQRSAYRRFVLTHPQGRLVDAAGTVAQSVNGAAEALKHVQVGRAAARVSADPRHHRLPVLCYHAVGLRDELRRGGKLRYEVSPARLAADLESLAERGYRVTSLAEHDPLGGRQVALTFDDGNVTDHEVVLPLLQRLGVTASFFVITAKLGKRGYLSPEQVAELASAGMEIGSHSHTHPQMTTLSADEQRAELLESRYRLEALLGRPVTRFCYPGGLYDAALVERTLDAGYTSACTTDWRHAQPGLGAYLIPRCIVGNRWYRIPALEIAERSAGFHARTALFAARDRARALRGR
jgi:peptidoglycan/xylan/chitin deacetylase (PgdA/CDA1 family)